MIGSNSREAPALLSENIQEKNCLRNVADDLKSLLIQGYELALERGLTPYGAIAIVLSWAADETCRLDNPRDAATESVLKRS